MSALNGETIVCGQHVGGDVQLRIFGDEFYARYETVDGYTVVYDTDRGRYCYATLAAGRFVSSGVAIGKPIPDGLRRHLKEDPEVRNERFGRRYDQLRPRESESGSSETRTLGPDDGLLEGRKLHRGTVRGLTVLVDFQDVTTNIVRADVEEMLNGDDYAVNGNYCSVKEYFQIVSNGRLTYENTVVGPIKLSKSRSHYIGTLLVEEALDAVVNDHHLDLSTFDSRNEGIVDAINFLYAGDSQYSGELWPHNSVKILQYGQTRTHYYQLTGLGSHKVDLRIGTICHENGHLLCRFPDMYDYGKRDGDFEKSQGIGRYCLMGSGNHLNDRRTPSPVCAYLRDLAGWTDRAVILNGAGSQVAVHGQYGTVMKYESDLPNEYFLIENRTRMGLDSHLPASGLAIYHCDTLGSNEWQTGTRNRHYQCALLQADGSLDLESNRNAGDRGDLFAQIPGIALSHDTTPSSLVWDGTDSGLVVSEVSAANQSMTFTIGQPETQPTVHAETSPNLLIPDDDEQGVKSTIPIVNSGKALSLVARVEIIHSWIGDLQVTLLGPDGSKAPLHNREGRNGDDIMKTYDSADFSALRTLLDKDIEGDWTLHVVDHARQDAGRLMHWSLDIAYESSGVAEGHAEPNQEIPDNDSRGISSVIELSDSGKVKAIRVSVDIEHTYIGDLVMDLIAPSGRTARLHDNAGRSRDNIQRAYDFDTTPALRAVENEAIRGEWRLAVRDLARLDVGTLKSWSIKINY